MVRVTEVLLDLHLQEQHVSIHLQINADGGFFLNHDHILYFKNTFAL